MISFLPTVATGDTWSASQHNTYIRDNMLALWPYISAGDLAYASSPTTLARLAIGAAGKIMYSTGSAPAWMAAGAVGELLKGAGAAAPAWLAKPSVTSILQNTPAGVLSWVDITALQAQIPAGIISDFGGLSIPTGWLPCDGSAVSRTTYASLFSAIGIAWGVGDGITTFNLPDLRSRTTIGAGQGTGLTNRALGSLVGSETHTLTVAEIPPHTHTYNDRPGTQDITGGSQLATWVSPTTSSTGSTGGGASHNNMQPSAAVTKIIKT